MIRRTLFPAPGCTMNPCRFVAPLALLLALAARPAPAQQDAPDAAEMASGRWRVRLTAPAAGITTLVPATVVQVRGDSMVVEIAGIQKTLSATDVTRLQRVEGAQSRMVHAAVGGVGGGLLGLGAGELRRVWSISGEDYRPVFGGIGVLVGALVGARFFNDRWVDVPGYAAVVPAQDGGGSLALGFELRF